MNFSTPMGFARVCGVKYRQLLAIAHNVDRNYRIFDVKKRSGGTRSLVTPHPTLKFIQRFIVDAVLSRVRVSDFAHGYVPGRSIKSHADLHKNSTSFIRIDIKDFFPSVKSTDVYKIFLSMGYDGTTSQLLASLCTFNGHLPQGAPTSPSISNIRMLDVDTALHLFSINNGLIYSRYADDIVLSGNRNILDLFNDAASIVEQSGFNLNSTKSFVAYQPKKVVLTGISISEGVLKIPKAFKRQTRQDAHKLLSRGRSAMFVADRFDPFAFDRVIGRLLFWSWVEPDAEFPKRYRDLLGQALLEMKSG